MFSRLISTPIDASKYANLINTAQKLKHKDEQVTLAFIAQRVVKFFPHKHPLSSDYWIPYALRLKYNTKRLLALKINTLQFDTIYYYRPEKTYVISYDFLPGITVHAAAKMDNYAPILRLPQFLAELHTKGIFFRDLHLENILIQPNGEFALIDVIRVGIKNWPLTLKMRARNLAFLLSRTEDQDLFEHVGRENFLASYMQACKLNARQQAKLMNDINNRCRV